MNSKRHSKTESNKVSNNNNNKYIQLYKSIYYTAKYSSFWFNFFSICGSALLLCINESVIYLTFLWSLHLWFLCRYFRISVTIHYDYFPSFYLSTVIILLWFRLTFCDKQFTYNHSLFFFFFFLNQQIKFWILLEIFHHFYKLQMIRFKDNQITEDMVI